MRLTPRYPSISKSAADQGKPEAQAAVGEGSTYMAKAFPSDYAKAMEWLNKSANQGNARAQDDIGSMYENAAGALANKDYSQAQSPGFKRLRIREIHPLSTTSGSCTRMAAVWQKDEARAQVWFKKALPDLQKGLPGKVKQIPSIN